MLSLAEGKHFCTGVEVADHKPDKVDDMIATFNRVFELIDQMEVPMIAVVQGYCLGGGMTLHGALPMAAGIEGNRRRWFGANRCGVHQ